MPSIFEFARDGQADQLRALVAANPDAIDEMRVDITPLMTATMYQRTECVEVLIQAGAELSKGTRYDWTPLMEAIKLGDVPLTRLILSYAELSDWCRTDDLGNTVYHIAAAHSKAPELITKLFAWTEGYPPNLYRTDGMTPLMVAVHHQNLAQVEALLAIGVDPAQRSRNAQAYTARDLAEGWPEGQALLDQQGPVVEPVLPLPPIPVMEAAPVEAPAAPVQVVAGLSQIQRRRPGPR